MSNVQEQVRHVFQMSPSGSVHVGWHKEAKASGYADRTSRSVNRPLKRLTGAVLTWSRSFVYTIRICRDESRRLAPGACCGPLLPSCQPFRLPMQGYDSGRDPLENDSRDDRAVMEPSSGT
ncbi:hypothetical protein PHSY_006072 [Pseudozyma hubeiensis SY62]|uniref:Uncharacterized protein n=1 Tax=Pseudozyma hubeiensis (strain SY62) TaxID=1305764 RepID=R9PAQ4_PSEHS|nr:hypothetical protein PHSY_006072 [Pseudozyma hubeiensis SY62]GAC98478.1 hypothetical protein PHSY_006072 [Pseudozyma hubeiensis SY62]